MSGVSFLADLVETLEGAVVLAVVAAFVTIEGFAGSGVFAEGMEGEGDSGGGVFFFGAAFLDFVGEGGSFHAPEPHLAPAADGHGFDEAGFDFGGGFEVLVEIGAEGHEAVAGLGFEEDGVGEEAVADAVAGGAGFAVRGDGALGFGSVLAGGVALGGGGDAFTHGGFYFSGIVGNITVGFLRNIGINLVRLGWGWVDRGGMIRV